MDTDPEIVFHRYFATLPPAEHQKYRGKVDLTQTSITDFERILLGLQAAINEALSQEDKNVDHHVPHGPFHFDYIDSDVENALAFSCGGFSFIGITEPLVYKLWRLCAILDPVAAEFLNPALIQALPPGALGTVLFRALLFFVVSHEYTHHVHGHISRTVLHDKIFNEISTSRDIGSLDDQALEIDADGYAAFLVINNLIHGAEREVAVSILELQEQSPQSQDNTLLTCFVMATGAFFYHGSPVVIDASTICALSHPPQAARMNWVVTEACRWCSYNNSSLLSWFTNENFNAIMAIVAEATWGSDGSRNWADQTEFFRSENGAKYLRDLNGRWLAHRGSLVDSRS